ncbi:MAG: CDP-glycerol glycerophosphotransferase family protein [Eubacterium sp.]|nr:CDP-glycerol glycerophosphotransferase family protein [Eubacterium sp.]
MEKINYRTTVNIADQVMRLVVLANLPERMWDRKLRVQAIFTQRRTERRFPMEVSIEMGDMERQVRAEAVIELPYVFYAPVKKDVAVTFALWCGTEEILLNQENFPVRREQFAGADVTVRKSRSRFVLGTISLPFLLAKHYITSGRDKEKAKKEANQAVYRFSGYSYSPRQQKTDFFASEYRRAVRKIPELQGNQVLFLSERLPEEGGNLMRIKRIFEEDPEISVTEFIHTETVDRLTREQLKECAQKCAAAKVIILEDFYPQLHSIRKRSETKIVQLWHACGAFKTFGFSRLGKPGGAPQSSMNHRNYDLVTVSSPMLRNIYAEALAINPPRVKALGVPRTDDLFDREYRVGKREELYRKYPALKEGRVVLFAPTFRGEGNKDAGYPAEAFEVNRFMEAMPEDVVLIVKHHPFVKQDISVDPAWEGRVLDLTGKDPINDLMIISDLLITDYSSSIFEAALLELPMLFYAFDEETYTQERDFYFDYRTFVPGPVENTFEDMTARAAAILEGDTDGFDPAGLESFRQAHLSALDGCSTERTAQFIREHILKL